MHRVYLRENMVACVMATNLDAAVRELAVEAHRFLRDECPDIAEKEIQVIEALAHEAMRPQADKDAEIADSHWRTHDHGMPCCGDEVAAAIRGQEDGR